MSRARRRGGFGYVVSKGTPTHPLFAIRWREGSTHKQQSGFTTRKDAADALARIRVGLSDGTLVEKRRAGVGFDQVAQEWLRLHSASTLRSHELNAMNYRRHLAPFFGDCPLSAVTPNRIREFRAKLQAKTYRRKRRGEDGKITFVETKLSGRMVNLLLALVRSVLKFAVTQGHIPTSPTDLIGRGKLMLPVEKSQLDPPIERPDDVGRVLEAIREARPDRYALFATLIYTGMRKGEVCGLQWDDVHLERRVIKVRRSYDGPTKSKRHRDVPIPSVLVDILRHHRQVEPYHGALVFPTDAGTMYTKNGKLEDVLHAALRRVGLKKIRLHDLRHVYGAHFVMAGGSIYDLQKNLGHHSVAFTAAVYGHLSQDHRVKESDRLTGLFAVPPAADVIPIRKGG